MVDPLTNPTTTQAPPDLITQVFAGPWIWLLLSLVVLYFIVRMWKGQGKGDPSTKPWYGETVRKDKMTKEQKKRASLLGEKINSELWHGYHRVGKVLRLEYDNIFKHEIVVDKKTGASSIVPTSEHMEIARMKLRKFGLWAWLKACFGFGFEYVTVSRAILTPHTTHREFKLGKQLGMMPQQRRLLVLSPLAHIFNDSDVWTEASADCFDANNQLVQEKHIENIRGYEMDFLRRLSVNQPSVAAAMEKASHDSEIKQQERKARTSQWVGS